MCIKWWNIKDIKLDWKRHRIQHFWTGLQCESKKIPPAVFWHFSPNGWEFLINFLHTYYMILYTLDYKFLFSYLQLWRSYAILSATTRRIFTFHYNFNFYVCLLSKWRHWWRHAIPYMFIDIIKLFLYSDLPQTTINKAINNLTQTSERVRYGRWWTFWAYYVNWVVALNMA